MMYPIKKFIDKMYINRNRECRILNNSFKPFCVVHGLIGTQVESVDDRCVFMVEAEIPGFSW